MDIEEIKKLLLSPSASAKKLEAAAAAMPTLIAEATERHKGLLSDRRAKLLNAPDKEVAALDAEASGLLRHIERLEAFAEEVDTLLVRKQEETAVAAVAARQADVIKHRDDVVSKIKNELPRHFAVITAILGEIAKTDIEIDHFQRFAADNGVAVDPLAGAEELARTGPSWPSKVVEEEIVTRWVFAENGNRINLYDVDANLPLPSDGKITAAIEHGRRLFLYRSSPTAISAEVVKKQFRKVTIKKAVHSPTPLTLAETIALPGVFGGESDVWAPMNFYSAPVVLDEIAKRANRSPSAEPARQTEVQWIPLPESGEAGRSSTEAA